MGMKLIFIYGPPAAGKLTIAEKLSEWTGIALFHNHQSRDLVEDIYGSSLRDHYGLVDRIREEVFEYCARDGRDLIFTYVYDGPDDDGNVKSFIDAIERNGGDVSFVELVANDEDLVSRVDNESRKQHKKLTDPERMKRILRDGVGGSIPFVNSFRINTSDMKPEEAAAAIIGHLSL